eukprot:9158075-Pyramimonas_sp.AAC.1
MPGGGEFMPGGGEFARQNAVAVFGGGVAAGLVGWGLAAASGGARAGQWGGRQGGGAGGARRRIAPCGGAAAAAGWRGLAGEAVRAPGGYLPAAMSLWCLSRDWLIRRSIPSSRTIV